MAASHGIQPRASQNSDGALPISQSNVHLIPIVAGTIGAFALLSFCIIYLSFYCRRRRKRRQVAIRAWPKNDSAPFTSAARGDAKPWNYPCLAESKTIAPAKSIASRLSPGSEIPSTINGQPSTDPPYIRQPPKALQTYPNTEFDRRLGHPYRSFEANSRRLSLRSCQTPPDIGNKTEISHRKSREIHTLPQASALTTRLSAELPDSALRPPMSSILKSSIYHSDGTQEQLPENFHLISKSIPSPSLDFPEFTFGSSDFHGTSSHDPGRPSKPTHSRSRSSSVIVLPGRSASNSISSRTQLQATASVISRWRRTRDLGTDMDSRRSDIFNLLQCISDMAMDDELYDEENELENGEDNRASTA